MRKSSKLHFLGIRKLVSGGQTGVDRGALDAAIALGIPHGGWCPKGRLAEDGPIEAKYKLQETDSTDYVVRTERNVIDSDATLILYRERLQGGTLKTYNLAKQLHKPHLRVRIDRPVEIHAIQQWIINQRIRILNVAGPRGSSEPTIHGRTLELIKRVFSEPILPLDTLASERQ